MTCIARSEGGMGVAAFGGIIMAAIVSQSHAMPQPNGFFAWIRACFVVSAEPEEIRQARKLIAAIERPSAGSVVVNGQNVGTLRAQGIPFLRRNFGLVFQDHKLLFDRSVFDNVMLPLEITGFDRREGARRARAALDKVGLLHKEKARPITLSGGEQQRLCIARAIVHRPAILLADEPTGNLDAGYAADIGELFRDFNRVGVTVVLATHDMQLAARLQPRLIEIRSGRVHHD
jgi:cell division transport system ATP-binding protein